MRTIIVIALSAAAALAGCTTATDDLTPAGSAAAAAGTLPWGLSECGAAISFVPVAAAAVASLLPEGFRALTPSEIGLPAPVDAHGDATISVELFQCGGVTGLDGSATEGAYGSVFVAVEPPAELKDADAGLSFVKLDTIVADAALRDALVAAGVPAVEGEATINVLVPGSGAIAGRIGDAAYSMRLAYPPTPPEELTLTFVEYTPVEGGFVTWKATASGVSGSAVGVLEMAAGSVPAQAAGSETAQAWVLLFEGSFGDASITLPA